MCNVMLQLPADVQERVKVHLTRSELHELEGTNGNDDASVTQPRVTSRVPMPTFPPTAMMYSMNDESGEQPPPPSASRGKPAASVPTELIAKVLSPPGVTQCSSTATRFYICSKCQQEFHLCDASTQTVKAVDGGHVYPRTVVANMATNPPTFVPLHPGVHSPNSRSCSTDSSPVI